MWRDDPVKVTLRSITREDKEHLGSKKVKNNIGNQQSSQTSIRHVKIMPLTAYRAG